ncbi:CAP domain-containing protein [Rhodococcus erythropolis]|uniref:CAP domain-containing protein n=1 Tax=Rhodococcus erythropolis TaxID=1833 RepID=UPI003013514D
MSNKSNRTKKNIRLKVAFAVFALSAIVLFALVWAYDGVRISIESLRDESSIPLTAAVSSDPIAPNVIESLVNERRTVDGKKPLATNAELRESACAKADHMLANDYWDHISPEGVTPWTFIKKAGYDYKEAGENLARGFKDDTKLVQAWMDSPTHRANVLEGRFTEQGICERDGTLGGKATRLVVQQLGARS